MALVYRVLERRWSMRTFTIRAAAAAAAERSDSKPAAASTSALARIGVDKVISVIPSRRASLTGQANSQLHLILWRQPSRSAEMTKM
jgi:hypothetical protein